MFYPDFYYASEADLLDKSLRKVSLDGTMTMRDGSLKKRSYYGETFIDKDGKEAQRYTVMRAVRAA